ncbi:MAG TPA: ankyrin repeat domain-containing protein [Gemmatimonadaceae bacterium]|nr:ankyrin repeat domain-containing protein [Gemmatimonadaceae bacterium]
MTRKLTPRSSLESLKREAKRWLKALRENDPAARVRLARAVSEPSSDPTLRDVQQALAREYGFAGWPALRDAVVRSTGAPRTRDDAIEALLSAANRGDAARVALVLDEYPDIINERATLRGHTGKRTALHFAMNPMSEAVVETLLARGADPNIRDDGDNAMPIHFAAERGALNVVKRLIEHGADPVGAGTTHELEVIGWATCFSYAFHEDVANYLLAHGARHTIHSATAMGAANAIREIVARAPDEVDRPMDATNHRRRPLHLAVIKRQLASLATLLEVGANPSTIDAAGLSPLDQAALDGQQQMVDLLLQRGATLTLPAAVVLGRDVDRVLGENPGALGPNGRFRTLIVRAAERAPGRVIEALLRYGASVDATDDEQTAVDSASGYTALHAAAFAGNMDAVRVLLANGANVRARDSRWHGTPAGWANYAKHLDVRDIILRGPIDLFDAIAYDRVDRFHEIFDGHYGLNESIGRHLKREPGPDEWTKSWWTPLAFAIVNGKPDAVRELLRMGARPTHRDPDGRTLRELAVEQGRDDIVEILDDYDRRAKAVLASATSDDHAARVTRFLTNACPDHHVRGGWAHAVARETAARLLEQHPEIARDSIYTAVVCGEVDLVQRMLNEHPDLARQKGGPKGSYGAAGSEFVVDPAVPSEPRWEPLLYLCFTRLSTPAAENNAVAIAKLLLDHGADPNCYFMAGDSRYSPLTGVFGEGEEARKPHPRRDELVRLLLEHGAEPYDVQVFYNVHFHGHVLWYLELIYEHTTRHGRASEWADPEWRMIDMGGYGYGARYILAIAVNHDDVVLATWALEHGADPNAMLPARSRLKQGTLHEEALKRGHLRLADVLARFGARTSGATVSAEERFVAAAMQLDHAEMERLVTAHPELRASTRAIFTAAERDRADVVAALLDIGVSANVEDKNAQRPLHIAAYANALRAARLLIERGAEVDPVERQWNNTPLDAAIYSDHSQMIELLAPYSRDVWSLTFTGQVARLRELLAEDPARARASWKGWTLLMRLPGDEARAMEIAKLLLARGADPSSRNVEGFTAADYAQKRGLDSVAELLRATAGDSGTKS